MRVLMVHHDPGGGLGGASHMAWRTADALAARGHVVGLAGTVPPAGLRPPPGGPAAARLGPTVPRSLDEAVALAGWVPDVVHVTDLADPTAAARAGKVARQAGVPFVLTPATDPALWSDGALGGDLARGAAVVFVLTPSEGRAMAACGVAAGRLVTLGQGPQLAGTPDPDGFRARVGAAGPLVLFLGRRLPTKGAQHLVAATPEIRRRHPGTTVVIAGPDPDAGPVPGPLSSGRAAVPEPAGAGPVPAGVRELGALDEADKHSALVAADVFCLPTVADAFPLAFVEAWWCATPVVSGPFPGAREVVRHGVDGLVTGADPVGVAEAVAGLLSSPGRRAAMGRAGRRRAEAELTWDMVAANAERGYERARLSPAATAGPTTSSHT